MFLLWKYMFDSFVCMSVALGKFKKKLNIK